VEEWYDPFDNSPMLWLVCRTENSTRWQLIALELKLMSCQMDGHGQLNRGRKGKLLESLTATFTSEYVLYL